ncbi:MAG: hypothetical protein J6Z25_00945 [Opitutales bacterium]|nr:hypothetical protein [Opitutales bacterium]
MCPFFIKKGNLAKAHIFAPLRWVKNKIIHGVEPEEEEAHRLLQSGEYDHIYTEAVGAHTGSATLYLPKSKACASLRTVDPAIAAAINFDESMWKQPQKITISVKTLADLLDPSCSYDFIKMILMGSDHDALVSANESLFLHGIGICCEARSVPLFQGMHTIEETTDFLKKKDFFLLQARNFDAFFFNTIYTKNPVHINTLEQVLKHCLLGFLLQHPYYIYAVLKHYEEKNGTQKILDPVFRILGIPRS